MEERRDEVLGRFVREGGLEVTPSHILLSLQTRMLLVRGMALGAVIDHSDLSVTKEACDT